MKDRTDRAYRPSMAVLLLIGMASLLAVVPAMAQNPANPLDKFISDPEKIEELKKEKEKQRAPIEFFRSQIMPNDVLPYIKANHWSMFGLEMRANHEDFYGSLQSRPVTLAGQPHEMIYRREARLIKGQRARLTLPILLPTIPKEIGFQLIRPEAIHHEDEWMAALRVLEPHQQMVIVLSKTANDHYGRWSKLRATMPTAVRRDDPITEDKQRYYRMVLPLEPDKPLLSPHPLTWSSISHVIWDGLDPEPIGVAQRQAMLDWLHWGGQLVIVGGAGPAFGPLRESFLAPYMPAEPSGENMMRSGDELKAMSETYRPPALGYDPDDPIASNIAWKQAWETFGRRYKAPAPIPATAKKPMFFTGLKPKPGSTVIPLGGPDDPPLGVEWKVGRGRVLMLAVSLSDPDLVGWPGYDTLVRRLVLRRPEERITGKLARDQNGGIVPPQYESLNGTDLTSVRYLSRDLGSRTRQALDEDNQPIVTSSIDSPNPGQPVMEVPVGEWLDSSELPSLSRGTLEKASGIEIPNASFVLKVILAYILILVPVNYLICRYLLGRREWAWVVVPTLSLAFAIGVERAAAYDVGYDSSCDEIDLLETHGDYGRGHLSRFASLYSTGRVKFSISFPDNPSALVLPLATGRSLRGEDATQSSFQTQPFPALTGFQVQPRSLELFRSEEMASLPGTVTITPEGEGPRTIINESGLDLNDAWIVELQPSGKNQAVSIGSIANGAKVPMGSLESAEPKVTIGSGKLDPGAFIALLLKRAVASKPEEVGEVRLIAWTSKSMSGEVIEPAVDRRRGFTLVVAHLQPAPLLDPGSTRYSAIAQGGNEPVPKEPPIPPFDPNAVQMRGMGRSGIRIVPGGTPIPGGVPTPPVEPPTDPAQPDSPGSPPSTTTPNPNVLETPRP